MTNYDLNDPDVKELDAIVKTAYVFDGITKDELRTKQRNDPTFYELIQHCVENSGQSVSKLFKVEDGILYKCQNSEKLMMIPFDLRENVLRQYHDHSASAQMSRDRLLE